MKNRVKKYAAIAVIVVLSINMGGCCMERDVTEIYPVKDYIITDDGIVATFEVNGSLNEFDFAHKDVYECDESSRIIGVGKELDGWYKNLHLYLYLNKADYEEYLDTVYGDATYGAEVPGYCVKCGTYLPDISGFIRSDVYVMCDECAPAEEKEPDT